MKVEIGRTVETGSVLLIRMSYSSIHVKEEESFNQSALTAKAFSQSSHPIQQSAHYTKGKHETKMPLETCGGCHFLISALVTK